MKNTIKNIANIFLTRKNTVTVIAFENESSTERFYSALEMARKF